MTLPVGILLHKLSGDWFRTSPTLYCYQGPSMKFFLFFSKGEETIQYPGNVASLEHGKSLADKLVRLPTMQEADSIAIASTSGKHSSIPFPVLITVRGIESANEDGYCPRPPIDSTTWPSPLVWHAMDNEQPTEKKPKRSLRRRT